MAEGSSRLEGPEHSYLALVVTPLLCPEKVLLLLLLVLVLADDDELVLKARALGGLSFSLPPAAS